MQCNKVAVVSLWAEDVQVLVHFYAHVLGLPPLAHHGERPHFRAGNSILTILKGKMTFEAGSAEFPLLAIAVDDLDEAISELEEHGVEMPGGIQAGEESRWVQFHDPAGNLLEIVEFPS